MRALIVDDDATCCQLLMKILHREGIETAGTTNSLAGYGMALRNYYDLYILDVRMPGLLGTEFVEGLKEEDPHVKILLISSFADAALRQTARDLEVALLSKPVTPTQLLTAIAAVLRRPL
ncbi:MAG: response regulator [Candidatus Binatia bacterium]